MNSQTQMESQTSVVHGVGKVDEHNHTLYIDPIEGQPPKIDDVERVG
jgi:hypothetical protein